MQEAIAHALGAAVVGVAITFPLAYVAMMGSFGLLWRWPRTLVAFAIAVAVIAAGRLAAPGAASEWGEFAALLWPLVVSVVAIYVLIPRKDKAP